MLTNPFSVLHMFANSYQEDFLHHPCRFPGGAGQPVVPQIFLLVLLEDGSDIAFLQPPGSSPNHHDLSQIIEGGLAMTPASSLSTRGRIPSGPTGLHMSGLLKCSLAWFSCIGGQSSLLQEVSNVGEVCLMKDKNPTVPGGCSSSGRKGHSAESGLACIACMRARSRLLRVFRCAALISYSRSALATDCVYFYSDTSRLPTRHTD